MRENAYLDAQVKMDSKEKADMRSHIERLMVHRSNSAARWPSMRRFTVRRSPIEASRHIAHTLTAAFALSSHPLERRPPARPPTHARAPVRTRADWMERCRRRRYASMSSLR